MAKSLLALGFTPAVLATAGSICVTHGDKKRTPASLTKSMTYWVTHETPKCIGSFYGGFNWKQFPCTSRQPTELLRLGTTGLL
jgi:hypothetical protein